MKGLKAQSVNGHYKVRVTLEQVKGLKCREGHVLLTVLCAVKCFMLTFNTEQHFTHKVFPIKLSCTVSPSLICECLVNTIGRVEEEEALIQYADFNV